MKSITRESRRGVALVGAFTALALFIAGCSGTPDSTNAEVGENDGAAVDIEPMELTFNHTNPAGGHFEAGTVAFTDYIEEATDGQITFQTLYSGSLLTADEAISGTGSGVADVSYTTTIGFDDEFPVGSWLSGALPEGDASYPLGTLANDAAVNEMIKNEPAIQSEYEAKNVHPLWFISATPGDMLCTEAVESLEDAKQIRARSGGGYMSAELEELGMASMTMPFADLYEGLQRDVLDCVYTTAGNTTFKPYGLTEVGSYYLPVQGWIPFAAAGFIINQDIWNSFSGEVQQIFEEASIETMVAHSKGAAEVVADFGATAEAEGVEFMETVELRERLAEVHEDRYENMVDDAPSTVDDPEQLISNLGEYQQKWIDLLSGDAVPDSEVSGGLDGEELRVAYEDAADEIDWDTYHSLLLEEAGLKE